ncbi:hypothetical protein F4824DRAFT_484375 [Ustulina deusta]|nr:hypothetical protein F4824DRAFT_484375 [Ustulina deusta]
MRFLAVLLLSLPSLIQGLNIGFISPAFQATTDTGPFAGDSRWPLGSTQIVAFTTPWEEYRLELWQQSPAGGSASVSSQFVYNQTDGNQLPQSFLWTVQTYEFQLANSPVFFFWLFNNADSTLQQSSAYFNITIGDTSSPSASPSSQSTPSPTSMSSSVMMRTTSNVIFSASTSSTPTSSPSSTAEVSKGLSTGAMAGIGVGASIGGILVLGAAGAVFLKRRRSRGERQQRPELPGFQPMAYPVGSPKPVVPTTEYTPKPVAPAEAPSYYHPPRFELGE